MEKGVRYWVGRDNKHCLLRWKVSQVFLLLSPGTLCQEQTVYILFCWDFKATTSHSILWNSWLLGSSLLLSLVKMHSSFHIRSLCLHKRLFAGSLFPAFLPFLKMLPAKSTVILPFRRVHCRTFPHEGLSSPLLVEATPFSQVGNSLGRTPWPDGSDLTWRAPLWAPPSNPRWASSDSVLLQGGRLLYLGCHFGSLWLKWSVIKCSLKSTLSFFASKITSMKLCHFLALHSWGKASSPSPWNRAGKLW